MHRFGPGHLAFLLATAAACGVAAALGRRLRGRPAADATSRCLAYVILAAMVADPIVRYAYLELTLQRALPLQLCDAAAAVCALALWTGRQLPFELAYYWGLAGVTQALLTPPGSLPRIDDPDTWRYFVAHAAALAGVFYLLAKGFRPRRGSWWRVTLLTMAYASLIGLVDWALGANYMWLSEKPEGSVLDLFGPWPYYILGGTAIGAALFYVLELPWWIGGGTGEGAAPGAP